MRYLFLVLFALPVFGQVLMPSQNFYAHYVDGRVEIERPPSVSPPPAAENTHLVLIQADFRLDYVYAHNETPDRDETLVNPNANYIEIPLTKNYYTFICGYWPDNTTHYVIVRDSIWVDSDIDLNLALSEARWQVNYDVQDERGRPLAVS
ncbi:MAG TPA: hypothetical protein PLG66_05225, partial [Calditrichia bacterium]|nr:hypothetical protein [Calditrichia bacterium]